VAACPACGKENPEGAKFCNECAAPLSELTPAAQLEERKVVSVLFCDLVGFTAASEAADPEDVRARLRPYHARLRDEIERYGGTVEKFIGDAVMAVFGAPVAHEDDAERAVRAGLRILEAIGDLNEADPGLGLRVRIGVNTGEAVVALDARLEEGEGIVTGDVVNTAARIESAAPVDGVAVSESTFRQTERLIVYEPLEPTEVKGKSGAVRLYQPVEPRSRIGSDLIGHARGPFVGRGVEKALVQAVFDRCVRDTNVQLITIVGEPGIGKSRLCAELFAYADERPGLVSWRQGRCLPYGDGITFWALGEIVKSHAGIYDSESQDAAVRKLERVLPDVEEQSWLRARLLPLLGLESDQSFSRDESFTAWRRFLESIAADRPAVIAVEDIHWADSALIDFLSYFAEWAEGVSLLLICTARPELFDKYSGWSGATRNSATINLSPLSEGETAELVQALLKSGVSEQVQRTILERSGGNPLYAEEFARLVADQGLDLAGEGGTVFPESIQALMAARLDTLVPEHKSVLQDAAVLGKVFWAGALAEMGRRNLGETELALHHLSHKELVRSSRQSSVEGEHEYAFWHTLMRDVVYGQIPRAIRARKHQSAATWIDAKAGQRAEDVADVLGYHYELALELARAAGDARLAEELQPRARRALVLAGDRASQLDPRRAVDLYHRALALDEPDGLARAAILLKSARALESFSIPEAIGDAAQAVEVYRSAVDEMATAEALTLLGRLTSYEGRTEEGRTYQLEARRLLASHPHSRELALALVDEARHEMMAAHPDESRANAEQAIALALELRLDDIVVRALQFRGIARCEVGDAGGLDDLNRSLSAALESTNAINTVTAYMNLADMTWLMHGPEQGLALHKEGQAFSERHGMTGTLMWSKAESTWMLYELGRWDEILAITDELLEYDRRQDSGMQAALALPYRALVLVRRGDASHARGMIADLLPRARDILDAQVLGPALVAGSLVRLALDDPQGSLELAREYEEVMRDRSDWHRARLLPEFTRTCDELDAIELAVQLAGGVSVDTGLTKHRQTEAHAIIAEARGQFDEALPLYELAAQHSRESGVVLNRAEALLGQGRCMLALDHAGADAPLTEARDLFASMGYKPALAETETLLAAG
jgi:class 3 adenylate cyclase/tetratricopeptide (TPR) repeat protein